MIKVKALASLFFLTVFNPLNTQAKIIFLDGIRASGKSTIARELANQLHSQEINTVVIESDEIALSLNPCMPPWAKGVLKAIERAKLLAQSANTETVIILDAFLWEELFNQLSPNDFFFVLVYAPLDLVIQRFKQRNYPYALMPQEVRTSLIEDFSNLYFTAKSPQNHQLVTRYGENENLCACRRYDLVVNSANQSPAQTAQHVICSFFEAV